jgi:hypothetical protein
MSANGGDGINIVALDQRDHSVLLAKSYNTMAVATASAQLVNDLSGVRRGSIIIAAAKNSVINMLSTEARAAFYKMGS